MPPAVDRCWRSPEDLNTGFFRPIRRALGQMNVRLVFLILEAKRSARVIAMGVGSLDLAVDQDHDGGG
ncbi:hypothetical protein PABG_11355 [Paracoccidioides brasiliensis Pb03]|uniref:Uncharacterized protein n=2 Tax=Paracoccidioides brasiliensis TaxID=121759 RepID=A0A0A0HSI4_PARBD|nr:uncharacterized protein PADG_11702 [Paracoccidioides brasiliensis Pb18]KGM92164.1 hypothetical protein PADG_11702 [Paracoccidioides brasiliensis Pb18]KGY15700.1 hypothetical protein PABG_11355 [Paracoccidioides brasiliensis Pb03]ODH34015.1 hypothetical protein ACO22_03238 [Paracoccidioides brasiliensis]ODH50974.1 hypothetical protein GX48_02935 [Paracoccidioides brasiliensis]